MGSRITPWSRIPNAGPCRPAKTMMGAPITAQGYRCFPVGNCPYPSRPVLVNRRRTEVAPRNVCIPSLETGTGFFAFATRPIEAVCFVRKGVHNFFTSKLVLKQILRRRALVLEMLFCTTCTSILISNFDFFSMIFESAGISVSMIGVIYASFGILNIIGVKFYEKTRVSRFSSAVLLLMPFSFLFLVSRSVPLILLGVCFQEIFFSYYNIHLNISVLNSIEDLQNSSYFQSMVSLINVVLRIVLTAIITLAFKVFPFGAVYGGFAAVTLCATCIYLRHTLVKDKS